MSNGMSDDVDHDMKVRRNECELSVIGAIRR